MAAVLIDTNVVSAIMNRQLAVLRNAAAYQRGGNKFVMCPIVYYEYRRWVLDSTGRDPDGRARRFDSFVANECEWLDLGQVIAQKAAWLWRFYSSQRVPDADTLIAACALTHGLPVATRNRRHFEPFGVQVEDWFQERPPAIRTRPVR